MFRIIFLILFVSFSISKVKAQKISWEKTEADKKECRKFKNNFFRSIGFTASAADIFSFPFVKVRTDRATGEITKKVINTVGISLFTTEYNLRYNLINSRDNFSISFNTRPTLSLTTSGYHTGFAGVLPIGIDFNFNAHSTFNNINNQGLSLGGGIKLNKYPLFVKDEYMNNTSAVWMEYFIRLEIKYRKYAYKKDIKHKFGFVGLQFGIAPLTMEFGDGRASQSAMAYSAKIVFGKLLGY